MKVRITGVDSARKIQAIKGIRAATGLGLKEAMNVAKDAEGGAPTVVELRSPDQMATLAEHYTTYDVLYGGSVEDLLMVLAQFPQGMRVGDLVRTLRATGDIWPSALENAA